MKRELYYFDIFPKVVQTGEKTTVTVEIYEKIYLPKDGFVPKIKIVPMTQTSSKSVYNSKGVYDTFEVAIKGNIIKFDYTFSKEQEYGVYVYINDDDYVRLGVYAVDADLYGLIPLKGDFHVHSNFSDGKESPEAVAAIYREAGYDFVPLTDHFNFQSSVSAKEFYKGVDIDINIITGEEIHPPDNSIHSVSFGADYSISDKYQPDDTKYREEVDEITKNLDPSIVFDSDEEKYKYASCLWVYEKIKEANGLAILPHPHWICDKTYNVRDTTTKLLFKSKAFDAFEIFGGLSAVENNMQFAFYYTACKDGYGDLPIVGSSDSHGSIYDKFAGSSLPRGSGPEFKFSNIYTIVFAKSNTTKDIITAVKNKNTVAVESYFEGVPRVHGDYRLVSYALFLLSDYFPLHAEICKEEGRLMRSFVYGNDESAKTALKLLSGRTKKMFNKYFLCNAN